MNIELKDTRECEYCNGEKEIYKGLFYLTDISLSIKSHKTFEKDKEQPCLYILGDQILGKPKATTESYVKIKYCPMCGRRL